MYELTPKELKIIQTYADCNMSKSAAGRALSCDRSRLYYHFVKIEDKTGLNPDNFYDLVELLDYGRGTP